MKTIFNNGTHKIQIPKGARVGLTPEEREKRWRDSELERTDLLMAVSDFPHKEKLAAYRQELRDWPQNPYFPDPSKRPQF